MLYRILIFYIRFLLGHYFKRIHIGGLEKLPLNKPIILACNHPSSFMEAILLASFLPRELHFIVRGDVFKIKIVRWFLQKTHQIPIYRLRDGMANLRNNSDTFDYCYEAMTNNAAIIIFGESTTQLVKRLRPLHRGIWRLAYNANENIPNLDLQIVPVGINFSDVDQFRSEVMVSIGDPIDVHEYIISSTQSKRDIIQSGTNYLYDEMKKQVIHFKDDQTERLGDPFLFLFNNRRAPKLKVIRSSEQFLKQQGFASLFSKLNPSIQKEINDSLIGYLKKIDLNLFVDRLISQGGLHKFNFLYIILIIIPAIIGLLFNIIPFILASYLRKKLVKHIEFFAPIRIGLWFFFSVLFLFIIFLALFYYIGFLALFVFITPLFIGFTLEFYDIVRQYLAARTYRKIEVNLDELRTERQSIMERLSKLPVK